MVAFEETAAYPPLSSPRAHYSDYQYCQSEQPPHPPPTPIPQSHPSVACRALLIDGSGAPQRWRETEGDGGRKRKLFNTSTGKESREGAGERHVTAALRWRSSREYI